MLVCPVNTVGVMGAGLAKAFRDRHPDLYYYYKRSVRYRQFHSNAISWFKPMNVGYTVLMVPTKEHWKNDSTIELVERSLINLVKLSKKIAMSSIATPPLGCGLGGLNYENQVKPLMGKYLNQLPCEVYVCLNR